MAWVFSPGLVRHLFLVFGVLAFGFDIETGGHVFQLMVTNAQGSFESEYIENARGEFENLDLFFGFNISRVFSI